MAYVVKPAFQAFSGLRPTSRAMSIKERTFGTPRRSHSCEPVLQTRFKTPPRSPKSIIAEISGVNNTELERTENRLKSKLLGQYSNAMKAMKLFDYSQNGYIQKHELRKVLENFCFKMTDSQFERLWVKYDKLNNGSMLNYMDFFNDLGVHPKKKELTPPEVNVAEAMAWSSQKKRPSSARHSAAKSPGRTIPQTPEKNIQQMFRERFLTNYDAIKRAIMKLDHRATGFVPLSEFKRVIVGLTTQMSDSLFQSLLERCDIKLSHRIHYERFLDYYGEARTNILWQPEASRAQNDIFTMLRSHVNNNFSSIKDAFLEFDYNKDGKISRNELRRIVEKFSFRLSEEDYSGFMSRVDPEHKGYISYHRFLEIFEKKESKHGHPWLNEKSLPQHVSPPALMTWTTVEEILRNKIKDNWQSVSSAFMKVDTNKDGFLSREELHNLLHSYCLPLSDEHFEMLWSLCDENNDGKIAFNEFLRKLGIDIISADLHGHSTKITDESEARERYMKLDQHARLDRGPAQISAEQALGVLRNHVSQKSTDLRKMFVKFDSNNDGKISRKEFRQVIESLGLTMADDQFDILSANVGFTHDTLSYHNFLKHFQHGRSSSVQDRHHFVEQRYDNSSVPEVLFSAEEAETQLRTKMQRSFSGLREAFYKFDENRDGFITRGEFRRILKLFMITLKDEEFEKLMNRLQFDKGERLNYNEFLKRFERRESIDGHLWLMGRSNVRAPKEIGYISAEEADEIIKKKAAQHWEDISKAFRNFDEDGNGLVTKKEMKNILYRYQLALTQDQFDKLWSRYDTDGNGFIDYKEFIGKLGVEFSPGDLHGHSTRIIEESYDTRMKPEVQNEIERQHGVVDEMPARPESQGLTAFEVEKRLKETVMAKFYDFVKAFVECDIGRNGSVSRSSLHDIINEHGFHISSQQMNQIWNMFPQNIDGTIHYNDFLSLFTNGKDMSETPETPPRSARKLHTRVRSAPVMSAPRHLTPSGRLSAHARSTSPTKVTPRIKVLTPPGYAKEIKNRIREKVHDRWRELQEAFVDCDKEKTGLVKLQQFKDVLFDCNIPLTPDEVRVLWRKHDIHNSGSIFYMDFLRSFMEDQIPQPSDKILFRSKLQPTRVPCSPGAKTDQLFALRARLRKQIQNEWKSMRRSFRALDQQGNGTCSILAFRYVLRKYNIELSEEEFYHVSTYYDKNLNSRIPYNEFIGAHLE